MVKVAKNQGNKGIMGQYTASPFQYQRRRTREVKVGDVGVGGDNPIRVQSMTIADTMETEKVVAEAKGLVEVGCEIVRITAPTIHHAENLKNIRDALRRDGIRAPLVADIHFTPQAAMIAADYVEKVRVNPGNYADRKLFAVKEYTDEQYQSELDRMADKFIPLVRKCKANGVAMRIGTNHGSLSDRIMNRYGDTPLGMVESALEFVRLCETEGYQELIISMKASSPFIMIEAYRLLAERMDELGMDYPFHLGVTEAGEGEDGRIKSAIGIGSLLEDGIGDTVRVSLTEDSIYEIPVAYQLVKKFNERLAAVTTQLTQRDTVNISWNPLERKRRESQFILSNGLLLGSHYAIGTIASLEVIDSATAIRTLEQWAREKKAEEPVCDILNLIPGPEVSGAELEKVREAVVRLFPEIKTGLTVRRTDDFESATAKFDFVRISMTDSLDTSELSLLATQFQKRQKILQVQFPSVESLSAWKTVLKEIAPLLINLETADPIYDYRRLAAELDQAGIRLPIHLSVDARRLEETILESASALGSLLMDGIGDSVEVQNLSPREASRLEFNILQASRLRITKAEFIACPSCGRTLFDLQETTQRIKQKTEHLKGVKIAIMGCIVNGPGEMADADFGYVGGGPGRIHLYVGKECVEKNIPSEIADEKLIELIKKHGQWVEPSDSDAAEKQVATV